MANAVQILFATPNFRDVQAAIGSVQASLDKLARAGISSYDRQKQGAERSFKEIAKSADRAAKEAARAQEREAKAAAKAQERAAKDAAKAIDRADKDAAKAKERVEKEKTRAVEREAKEQVRIRNAANTQSLRDWKRDLAEQSREQAKALRDSESRARAIGRGAGGAVSRVVGTAGRIAAGVAAVGGGFSVADSLGRGIKQEETAGVIFRGASQKGDFRSAKDVESLAESTAMATGGTTEDILAGLDQFVRKTGDLGAAKGLLEDMAKLSAATGTNFADMGNTAAEVQNQLGDAAETMNVMRALAQQGKAGAIDIKDLGQYGGRLAASAAKFDGPLAGNIESFGAIAQLAKKLGGATDTAEATESVARLSSDFLKHEDVFKSKGVDIFSDKSRTKFRNAEDIITEAVVNSKGDLSVIRQMFGEQSIRAATGAQVAYTAAGGGRAGEAAIREQFRNLKSTTMTKEDVDEGVAARLRENSAQLNIAYGELVKTVNTQLMPLLPGLITQFRQLIPELGKFLGFLTSLTPWQGIGLLVGGAIAKDIAAAQLGKGVEAAVTALINRIRGGGGGSSSESVDGSTGGGGKLGKGLAVAGAAAAGFGVGSFVANSVIDPMLNAEERGKQRANIAAMNVESVGAALAAGRITPEQAEERRKEYAKMVSETRVAGDRGNAAGALLESVTGVGRGVSGFKEDRGFSQNSDPVTKALEKLQQTIEEKSRQIAAIEISGPGSRGPTDPGSPYRGAAAP